MDLHLSMAEALNHQTKSFFAVPMGPNLRACYAQTYVRANAQTYVRSQGVWGSP